MNGEHRIQAGRGEALQLGVKQLEEVRRAVREAARRHLSDPNVTLVDYGFREEGGELMLDEAPRVRVHLRRKYRSAGLKIAISRGITRAPIPDEIGGVQVARPVGSSRLHPGSAPWFPGSTSRARFRPRSINRRTRRAAELLGGISVSHAYGQGYGTLGGPVEDRTTGVPMILSNWHVLSGAYGRPGTPVFQPAVGDGGGAGDRVADLSRHAWNANLDAAVAELTDDRILVNDQLGLGPIRGVGVAQLGMVVVKSGRTTAVTSGVVTGIEGFDRMTYRRVGTRFIRHVLTITPRKRRSDPSGPGDSGSLWIDRATMRVVGLHYCGNAPGYPEKAQAMDIGPVLDALEVDLCV